MAGGMNFRKINYILTNFETISNNSYAPVNSIAMECLIFGRNVECA